MPPASSDGSARSSTRGDSCRKGTPSPSPALEASARPAWLSTWPLRSGIASMTGCTSSNSQSCVTHPTGARGCERLGLRPSARPAIDSIIEHLATARSIPRRDNCEHLVSAVRGCSHPEPSPPAKGSPPRGCRLLSRRQVHPDPGAWWQPASTAPPDVAIATGTEVWLSGSRRNFVGPDQNAWLRRLRREHANLRVALDFCLTEPGEAVVALHMAGMIDEYWSIAASTRRRHWV